MGCAFIGDGAFFTKYAVDGTPLERVESSSFYGAALPFLLIHAPSAGAAVRGRHLSDAVWQSLRTERNRYFDANWVWFGLAAADGLVEERTPPVTAISSGSARP
jgi:endoglucanase